jgi:hypothetical protein
LGNFIERSGEVSVFVQIANDGFGNFADSFRADAYAELPIQMVGKTLRRRKKFVERRLFDFLAFAVGNSLGA